MSNVSDLVGAALSKNKAEFDTHFDAIMNAKIDAALDTPAIEEAAKIACLKCDAVSSAAAWQKNHGTCPKCKKSSRGVAEDYEEFSEEELEEAKNAVLEAAEEEGIELDEEELLELSKKTLGSYIKKASHEKGVEGYIAGGETDGASKEKSKATMRKRTAGIHKAVDKLAK